MLTTLGEVESRAVDGTLTQTGTFKLDANGNISAIGVFVNEETGVETRSNLSVVPGGVLNLTENYMYFEDCRYFDEDGDEVGVDSELQRLIVRRSDGLIYSAQISDGTNYVDFQIGSDRSAFIEDGAGRLIAVCNDFGDNNGYLGRLALSSFEGTFERLTTGDSPLLFSFHPKLFLMNHGVIAMSTGLDNDAWYQTEGGHCADLVYPNGGYDHFVSHDGTLSSGAYIILKDGLIYYSYDGQTTKYINIGSSYGQSTEEEIGTFDFFSAAQSGPASWYDMANKVLIKIKDDLNGQPNRYMVYDKQTRQFSLFETGFDNVDNTVLWEDYLCNGRFYGISSRHGKPTQAVWIDPVNLTTGQTDLNLGNEIDIKKISVDYKHATAQLTGTRRSDSYNVAISVDLRTGERNTIFSAPNREIISLIPLN